MILKLRKKCLSTKKRKKYHTLKNLITALQIEASELAEPLLWRDVKEKTDLTEEEKKETAEEAADVFIYLLLIANKLGLDLDDEVEKKITINEKKYPLEKCTEEFKKHKVVSCFCYIKVCCVF